MSRRIFAVVFFLAVPLLQGAQPTGQLPNAPRPSKRPPEAAGPNQPNTLTRREIVDGWLLLFDGETTFGWMITGEVKVVDGMLKVGGDKPAAVTTKTPFGPCIISFEYLLEGKGAEKAEYLFCGKNNFPNKPPPCWTEFRIYREEHGSAFGASYSTTERFPPGPLLPKGAPVPPPKKGSKAEAEKQNMPVRTHFGFLVPAGVKLSLRNIKFKPLKLESLFNGTDLAGWKEHPGKKSKFSVENDTIRIQNGPGDLQSVGQWDDFVLQLECKTNGNRLNSGVFFRCRPGEYQQGYEAQIHNGFNEQMPKEYTIEEFDPKTNKPIDKKKVKYTAVDYGTGAIYRRVPARKQMAKDNEWFTMTVIAAGRHIATWVNGVQMVDWTDNRPLADNARNGCRLEKGPISFQGHDPTTDLNFRNIRIGQLKK